MAQLPIPYGTVVNDVPANDITARTAFQRIQDNFTDLYALQSQTVNAGDVRFAGEATTEAKIQAAINQAVIELAKIVFVPADMLPYDASLVTFNTTIQMVREGGAFDVADVKAYGAAGDNSTSDYAAFAGAIAWAGVAEGRVIIPASGAQRYVIDNTLVLPANIVIQGQSAGITTPIIRFTSTTKTCFHFAGTTEAESMNIGFRDFQLEGPTGGIGIRARNFTGCHLSQVNINHFRVGLWTDWGHRVYVNGGDFTLNTRGVQLGGNLSQTETPSPGAGVRGGPATPWLDTAVFRDVGFSQNQVDINDMGSATSLGGLTVDSCTFFESSLSPVAGKVSFIHIAGRKAYKITNSWIEAQVAGRSSVRLSNVDYDGNTITPAFGGVGAAYGGRVECNHFLSNSANAATIGVEVIRGQVSIEDNVFEFGAGSTPIKLSDTVSPSRVGPNTYLTYADAASYVGPILIAGSAGGLGGHAIHPAKAEMVRLTYSATINTDPAEGSIFSIAATNTNAFTINSPSNQGLGVTTVGRAGPLTYIIANNSGGSMGTITWSGFYLAGAFTNPANGGTRSITFWWNGEGGVWQELSRGAADF